MANENYLIPMEDERFEDVLMDWYVRLMIRINQSPLTTNYNATHEFICSGHNVAPEMAIRKDIAKCLRIFNSTQVDVICVAYSKTYVSLDHLGHILEQILTKRRNKLYELSRCTAYSLTAIVDEELLDYQIPDVNLMMIRYTGAR